MTEQEAYVQKVLDRMESIERKLDVMIERLKPVARQFEEASNLVDTMDTPSNVGGGRHLPGLG